MGLGDLKRKFDFALACKRAWAFVESEGKMGKAKPAIIGILGGVFTAILSAVFTSCPDLKAAWPSIATAVLGGFVTTYLFKPRKNPGFKAFLVGAGGCLVSLVVVQVSTICPDLITQLPAICMSGATVGIGLYVKSHRQQ